MQRRHVLLSSALTALIFSPQAFAQRTADVLVIGSKEQEVQLAGSGHYIGRDRISAEGSTDVMHVLKKEVPGATMYGEDGYGLFPNISFRGGDAGRASKVTIMEDGILSAPAPYSAPAAYYSPYMGRMSGLEVLKGSSQVLYGPSTTGGVINYLSTPLRQSQQTHYTFFAGQDNETQLVLNHGDRVGNFSYLVEMAGRQTDGFTTMDGLSSTPYRTEDTGHRLLEPMIKLAYDIEGKYFQRIELKYGTTDLEANETYLGLSDADFEANPYRSYSATRFDRIETEQKRTYLRHLIGWGENSSLTTTAYYNSFARNWYKLNDVQIGGGGFNSPNPNNAAQYGVLTGTAAGDLRVRANGRSYEAGGIEQKLDYQVSNHRIKAGWRYHRDYERRLQWQDVYTQDATGFVTGINRGTKGSQSNVKAEAEAWSLYIQDEITIGKWSLVPGLRYETVDYTTVDYSTANSERTGKVDYINPGLGVRYEFSETLTWFGGLYKGSALPGPSAATRANQKIDKAESSYNVETGLRARPNRASRVEGTLFYTQLKDMLALESLAVGSTTTTSIGKALSYGVEFKGVWDLGEQFNKAWSNPWYLTATYNKAEIDGSYTNSGYLSGSDGNQLPYSPELAFTLGTGFAYKAFSFDVNGSYNGTMYKNGTNLASEKIASFFVVDASLGYQLSERAKLIVSGLNVLDNEIMISRSPYGARAGRPQTVLIGLQGQF